jgi:predicted RNA polymerase sigma factor
VPSADDALARALRDESAPLVAALYRLFGNFDIAEEAVQGAVVEALPAWRRDGIPDKPGAWLYVAAKRNALDLIRAAGRRDATASRLRAAGIGAAGSADVDPLAEADATDDRLALLFACCHPALPAEARLALTLRAVVGLTTPQLSRAFLVSEATLAQRIVRAKRKIVAAGISLQLPDADDLPARLGDVLTVVYVTYNEAFVSTTGRTQDRDLGADAVWLASVIATSLPDQAEAWGLAALLTLQHARASARFDASGNLILLRDQDRSRWDGWAIAVAERMLERASSLHRPGPFQLQAAIAACHASSPSWADTDWLQIVTLYDLLVAHDRSPMSRLNRAVALAQLGDARKALDDVDALTDELGHYHLFHATRAEFLRTLGREADARAADTRALDLTGNEAEQRLLRSRLRSGPLTDGS